MSNIEKKYSIDLADGSSFVLRAGGFNGYQKNKLPKKTKQPTASISIPQNSLYASPSNVNVKVEIPVSAQNIINKNMVDDETLKTRREICSHYINEDKTELFANIEERYKEFPTAFVLERNRSLASIFYMVKDGCPKDCITQMNFTLILYASSFAFCRYSAYISEKMINKLIDKSSEWLEENLDKKFKELAELLFSDNIYEVRYSIIEVLQEIFITSVIYE